MVKDVLENCGEITAHDIFQELVSQGLYKYALDLTLHIKLISPAAPCYKLSYIKDEFTQIILWGKSTQKTRIHTFSLQLQRSSSEA